MTQNALNQFVPISVPNQKFPSDSKTIFQELDFATDPTIVFLLDLTLTEQANRISCVQTIYVDNSENSDTLRIKNPITQQVIEIPSGMQGYYPVLIPAPAKIECYLPDSTVGGLVRLNLVNVPMPAATWQAGQGAVIRLIELATPPTDYSGTLAAATTEEIVPANPARAEVWVYNVDDTDTMWINIFGDPAAADTAGSIALPPLTGWSGKVTSAIQAIGTMGQAFTAGDR